MGLPSSYSGPWSENERRSLHESFREHGANELDVHELTKDCRQMPTNVERDTEGRLPAFSIPGMSSCCRCFIAFGRGTVSLRPNARLVADAPAVFPVSARRWVLQARVTASKLHIPSQRSVRIRTIRAFIVGEYAGEVPDHACHFRYCNSYRLAIIHDAQTMGLSRFATLR